MGTSSYQRSPHSERWDAVREAYDSPEVPPRKALSRIVAAFDAGFRVGLGGPAPALCLGIALQAADELCSTPDKEARIPIAGRLRERADAAIERAKARSQFGEIALDALVQTVMDVQATNRLPRVSVMETFVSKYMARTVAYVASRDTSAHVGGPRLEDVAAVRCLVTELQDVCEAAVKDVPLEDLTPEAEFEMGDIGFALVAAVERALAALAEEENNAP